MNKLYIVLLASMMCTIATAQLTNANKQVLQKQEEEIKKYARDIVFLEEPVFRYRADSFFTRGLVKALKTPYSFYYNFDSLNTIAQVFSPDSTFKIFTWQLAKDYSSVRQKGAIQMNTKDGSLKLIPLFDVSDEVVNPADSIRTPQRWIGALYYKIVLKTSNQTNYYTLLGFDDNNEKSNKKWIEVLTFDKDGNPFFGGKFFQYPNDNIKPKQPVYRYCIEYKKDASAKLSYYDEMGILVMESLVSEEKDPTLKHTLVPSGDYEGFKWVDGRWIHIDKLFDYKIDMNGVDPMMGNPPVPMPVKEEEPVKEKKKKGKG